MAEVKILTDQIFLRHHTGYAHPESPKRLSSILEALQAKELVGKEAGIEFVKLDKSRKPSPSLVHTESYIESLRDKVLAANDLAILDEDTYVCRESFSVALAALAMEEQAVDLAVVAGSSNRGQGQPFQQVIPFVMARPPGHHALSDRAMGFCLFANAAYAARYAQQRYDLKRVAILDWDIHHGNGTEEIFYRDDSVLTISLHAYPHWPEGCGGEEARGLERGEGYNLNIPLEVGSGDREYIAAFEERVMPKLDLFKPELLIIAAGFDAHKLERNSGTNCKNLNNLTEFGFSYMTHRLLGFARKNEIPMMLTLEGGYYLPSLVSSINATIDTVITEKIISNKNIANRE
jgi:acetoin utilization deacetylase AcuC-like enzyme